jgi:hypothetical protein
MAIEKSLDIKAVDRRSAIEAPITTDGFEPVQVAEVDCPDTRTAGPTNDPTAYRT